MGGKTRDRERCYMHAKGNTLDELVADAVTKKRQGFTAIRFSPFAPDYHLRKSFEEWVGEAERRVGAVHEALQGDADICIELHRQMNPAETYVNGNRYYGSGTADGQLITTALPPGAYNTNGFAQDPDGG